VEFEMTEEQNAAYVFSQSACALIEAMGMVAENAHRQQCGNSIAYGEEAFNALINKYGIHHNAVVTAFGE
jgi:hypothetical protein